VLPSGRVAVVGGYGTNNAARKGGEVFDPVKREWEPLGAEMAYQHFNISTMAVAGGLIAVGGTAKPELYQEECGRWFSLPRRTLRARAKLSNVGLVSMPATALSVVSTAEYPEPSQKTALGFAQKRQTAGATAPSR
jgi:hypothetical protein